MTDTPLAELTEVWLADIDLPWSYMTEERRQEFRSLTAEAVALAAALEAQDGMIVLSPPHHRHPDKWLIRVYDHDADEDDAEMAYGEGPTLYQAATALAATDGEEPGGAPSGPLSRLRAASHLEARRGAMKIGVALPEGTTLPGVAHGDTAIILALDTWAERIGDSIGFSGPLYPAIFPIWCDLGRMVDEPAPVGSLPPSAWLLDALRQRGVRPAVYLQTSGWLREGVPNRPNSQYVAGLHDAELAQWARMAARRLERVGATEPLLVRPDWEMNGHWAPWSVPHTTPAEYVAMWRRIHAVMRAETDRLAFWWCPTARGWDRVELDAWWPGGLWVDVVGFDSYDSGDGKPSLAARWAPTYSRMASRGLPIIVGETGIARRPGNAKVRADWWRGLADIALDGVVAMDMDLTPWEGEGRDWRLNAGQRRTTARLLR